MAVIIDFTVVIMDFTVGIMGFTVGIMGFAVGIIEEVMATTAADEAAAIKESARGPDNRTRPDL